MANSFGSADVLLSTSQIARSQPSSERVRLDLAGNRLSRISGGSTVWSHDLLEESRSYAWTGEPEESLVAGRGFGLLIYGRPRAEIEPTLVAAPYAPIVLCEYDLPDATFATAERVAQRAWYEAALNALGAVLALPANWDGYGAERPEAEHAFRALVFLQRVMRDTTPLPAIVPLADGGVQVEWHRGGLDIEATFTGAPEHGLYFSDLTTGREYEGSIDAGIDELRRLMARLEEADTATTPHAAT
jgi:hypothetical protein